MGKDIARIVITTNTLQCAPNARQRGKKTQEARVGRVALSWIAELVGIEAKEQFNVLGGVSEYEVARVSAGALTPMV